MGETPEARYAIREGISLAFVATLQWLTPGQRVGLLQRDVLAWRAQEVAEVLGFQSRRSIVSSI